MDIFFRNQIIQNIEHIGTSPELSLKILGVANKHDADLNEVTKIILEDPTICAQILKLANSSYFYRGGRINNISGAVVHLGLENVRRVLFAIEMIGIFKANSAMTFFNEVNFWKHSVAGAALASEIGKTTGGTDIEHFYICGLLRNIGVLVTRQFLPREFHLIYDLVGKYRMSFKGACKETIGMDHREIAQLIGMRWNLPDRIISAIMGMDDPTLRDEPTSTIAGAVTMADAALAAKGINEWDPFYQPALTIRDESIFKLCERTLAEVEKMQQELW